MNADFNDIFQKLKAEAEKIKNAPHRFLIPVKNLPLLIASGIIDLRHMANTGNVRIMPERKSPCRQWRKLGKSAQRRVKKH